MLKQALGAAVLLFAGFVSQAMAQGKVAILMPGAGGAVPSDFLVRNQSRIGGKGVRTVVTTSSSEAASISQQEAASGSKVILVAMSRGAVDAAGAVAGGAKLNGLVIVSGVLREARQTLGSPSLLPRTLLIHNKNDACELTQPQFAQEFAAWSGGRASVRWVNVSGPPVPRECGPFGAHGFHRQDGGAVAAINGFINAR